MSDYTPVEDYSAKDALSTGDPDKLILGADIDSETAAIQTAIATKYDSGDLASQAQAEAGTSNVTLMTPLRVEQAIVDKAASDTAAGIIEIATAAEVEAGTSTSLAVTPGNMPQGSLSVTKVSASGTQSKTSSTSYSDVTGLTGFTLKASTAYIIEFHLNGNLAGAISGMKFRMTASAGGIGATNDYIGIVVSENHTGPTTEGGSSSSMSAGITLDFTVAGAFTAHGGGYVLAGGSGATLDFQWAQKVSNGSALQLYGGSRVTLTEVPQAA